MSGEDSEIKLVRLRDPEPSSHFDERMNWTLADVRRMFPTGPSAAEQPRPGPALHRQFEK